MLIYFTSHLSPEQCSLQSAGQSFVQASLEQFLLQSQDPEQPIHVHAMAKNKNKYFITFSKKNKLILYYIVYPGKNPSKKQIKKLIDKECYFCGCDEYALLDVHRIIPGSKYKDWGMLTLCSLCHRKVHANIITILGKHFSTSGQFVINYIDEKGIEQWK